MMENTLLWSLTQKGQEEPKAFLFGTAHTKDASVFTQIKAIERYVVQCNLLATEVDLERTNEAETLLLLPYGKELSDYLTDKQYNRLIKVFQRECKHVSIQHFLHYHPLVLLNFLSLVQFPQEMPYSLDEHLYRYAKEEGLQVTGIEEKSYLQRLTQEGLQAQFALLKKATRNFKQYKVRLTKSIDAYKRKDIQQLYRLSKKSMGGMRSSLIYDRNRKMVNKIEDITKEKKSFFAVGAAHLSGQYGLLNLLKQKGYKVRPIIY